MALGGHVFKQTTLTGETIQDTQSLDELNNPTPLVNTDASPRIKNGHGKTRGKGLEKMKKAVRSKMKIDIPVDSCEDILKNRSLQWCYKLKQLFESARSEEEAPKIEVPELTLENWNRLCDMWIDPKHKGENEPEKVEEPHRNNMKDLKDLYTSGEASMITNEIVDTVLGTKSGYIRGLGYGPKPNTARATQRKTAELEDSLRKAKQEAASAQNNLQNRLNAAELW
ncbi:hypothetical protein KY289_004202 [Solanum tuberosum]|nr:hypothetical protein KY289_004202 [Solanum tuberosum]